MASAGMLPMANMRVSSMWYPPRTVARSTITGSPASMPGGALPYPTLPEDCGNCDICLDPPERFDGTEAARKVLSCVYRLRQSFGIKHVVDVLRGADNERIRKFGHDRLSTYGIGQERAHAEWISIARQLIHRGYLVQDIAAYSVLKLAPAALQVLRGEEEVELARPRIREKAKKKPAVALELGPPDQELFEKLRELRRRLAEEAGVPPYIVFGDAALVEMSRAKPRNEAMGSRRLAVYSVQP